MFFFFELYEINRGFSILNFRSCQFLFCLFVYYISPANTFIINFMLNSMEFWRPHLDLFPKVRVFKVRLRKSSVITCGMFFQNFSDYMKI